MDDIPLDVAIMVYYEKHHAMRIGDMNKLRELKNKYPVMFENEKDSELKKIIDEIKVFAKSACYNVLRKASLKKKLLIIENAEEK